MTKLIHSPTQNSPAVYKVAVVNVSTSFAGRHGRRVHTSMILVEGHNRIRVEVKDEKYTRSARAAADWKIGEFVQAPSIGDRKYVTLVPEQITRVPIPVSYRPSELRLKSS